MSYPVLQPKFFPSLTRYRRSVTPGRASFARCVHAADLHSIPVTGSALPPPSRTQTLHNSPCHRHRAQQRDIATASEVWCCAAKHWRLQPITQPLALARQDGHHQHVQSAAHAAPLHGRTLHCKHTHAVVPAHTGGQSEHPGRAQEDWAAAAALQWASACATRSRRTGSISSSSKA